MEKASELIEAGQVKEVEIERRIEEDEQTLTVLLRNEVKTYASPITVELTTETDDANKKGANLA